MHVAGFLAVPGLASGESWAQTRDRVRELFLPTLVAESVAWPIVQAANFALVPLRHQLLVINLWTVADTAFLSWWKERGGKQMLAGEGSSSSSTHL